jgi:hypothetical protein
VGSSPTGHPSFVLRPPAPADLGTVRLPGAHLVGRRAPVAQGIEQWPSKPRVAGSNPAGRMSLKGRFSAQPRRPRGLPAPPLRCPLVPRTAWVRGLDNRALKRGPGTRPAVLGLIAAQEHHLGTLQEREKLAEIRPGLVNICDFDSADPGAAATPMVRSARAMQLPPSPYPEGFESQSTTGHPTLISTRRVPERRPPDVATGRLPPTVPRRRHYRRVRATASPARHGSLPSESRRPRMRHASVRALASPSSLPSPEPAARTSTGPACSPCQAEESNRASRSPSTTVQPRHRRARHPCRHPNPQRSVTERGRRYKLAPRSSRGVPGRLGRGEWPTRSSRAWALGEGFFRGNGRFGRPVFGSTKRLLGARLVAFEATCRRFESCRAHCARWHVRSIAALRTPRRSARSATRPCSA